MSAPIDAERFSQYFGGWPIIRVPGFTHHVKTFYLEVLSILKTPEKNHLNAASSSCSTEDFELSEEFREAQDEAIEMAYSNEEFDPLLELISSEGTPKVLNYQHSSTGVTPLMVFAGKGRVGDVCSLLSLGADCYLQDHDGKIALDWAKCGDEPESAEIIKKHMEGTSSSSMEEQQLLEKYMSSINSEFIDVVLMEQLLRKICMESKDVSLFSYLGGKISIRPETVYCRTPFLRILPSFRYYLCTQWSQLLSRRKFSRGHLLGVGKLSSLLILLRLRLPLMMLCMFSIVVKWRKVMIHTVMYQPYSQLGFHKLMQNNKRDVLVAASMESVTLPEFQAPEIKRMPIGELCLQVKMLDPNCKVEEFLKKTLDSPVPETIKNAIAVLQDIGAFSLDEQLTEFGWVPCQSIH